MSKRGMDFLELWMERNLPGAGDADHLARRVAAALAPGIGMQEIEVESGPLEAYIAAALAHSADGGDVVTEDDD